MTRITQTKTSLNFEEFLYKFDMQTAAMNIQEILEISNIKRNAYLILKG